MIEKRTSDEAIKKAYFNWLCDLVKGGMPGHNRHKFMLSLHQKDFYTFLPNDDNRAIDGVKLREQFADEVLGDDCPCLDGPCSILEMLVALSKRIDFQLAVDNEGERLDKWFWQMIDNLRLDPFSNSDANANIKIDANNRILDRMMSRKYSADGQGGIFPLKHPKQDQRKVEIWYQFMAYLDENYEI